MIMSYIRTVILYSVLILVIRLMGKRQIGQMEASEFVVTMLVANLASIPMQDSAIALHTGLVPILTVLGMELVLSALSVKNLRFRRLLCGKPVILIENGNIIRENLKRTRVTLDELSVYLRQKDVLDPRQVQYAILETNGVLSVFPYASQVPASAQDAGIRVKPRYLPVTLVSDGRLIPENLKIAGKSRAWVEKILRQKKTVLADTFYLAVDASDQVIFYRRES